MHQGTASAFHNHNHHTSMDQHQRVRLGGSATSSSAAPSAAVAASSAAVAASSAAVAAPAADVAHGSDQPPPSNAVGLSASPVPSENAVVAELTAALAPGSEFASYLPLMTAVHALRAATGNYKHCRKPGELQRDLFQGGSGRNGRALKRSSAVTLMHRPKYKLTKKDLEHFDEKVREKVAKIPSQCLTGDVINYFASLLNLRFSSKGERAYAFGTDFYMKFSEEGPERVTTWEHKVYGGSILNLEVVLLPVSDGEVHHKLAVVDVPRRSVYLYDSFGGVQDDVDAIAKNVTKLFNFFTKKHGAESAGTFRGVLKASNKQRTGVDYQYIYQYIYQYMYIYQYIYRVFSRDRRQSSRK